MPKLEEIPAPVPELPHSKQARKETTEFLSAVFLATVGGRRMMDINIFDGFKFEQEAHRKDLEKITEKFRIFALANCAKHTIICFIFDIKKPQKRSKLTSPLFVSRPRTVILAY